MRWQELHSGTVSFLEQLSQSNFEKGEVLARVNRKVVVLKGTSFMVYQ